MLVRSIKELKPDRIIITNPDFKITSADSGRNKCG